MPTELAPDDVTGKVLHIIADKQRIPAETVTLDSTFEELKIDSLDAINIIFALEDEFRIDIPDGAVQNMRSVRDSVEGVRRLVAEKEETVPPGAA